MHVLSRLAPGAGVFLGLRQFRAFVNALYTEKKINKFKNLEMPFEECDFVVTCCPGTDDYV